MALKLQNFAKGFNQLNFVQTSLSSRQKHTAVILDGVLKMNKKDQKKGLHASAVKSYPSAPSIPLPLNMTQIFGNETGRFTPERARDITGPVLVYQNNTPTHCVETDLEGFNFVQSNAELQQNDLYTESYDCNGAVSLNSSMQSNVPQPFSSEGKSMHLNMPGGQWARNDKYIADDMQSSHYARIKPDFGKLNSRKGGNPLGSMNSHMDSYKYPESSGAGGNIIARNQVAKSLHFLPEIQTCMRYSTSAGTTPTEAQKTSNDSQKSSIESSSNVNEQSAVTKLKRAVKDYGSTVIVFHVGLSLASLGTCYLAISSGLDVPALIQYLGFVDNEKLQGILSNSSTFLIAYAVHKLFAPVRISITLGTTPFLVRYLRKVGILKMK